MYTLSEVIHITIIILLCVYEEQEVCRPFMVHVHWVYTSLYPMSVHVYITVLTLMKVYISCMTVLFFEQGANVA